MKKIILIILFVSLFGCGEKNKAKNAVRDRLLDGISAQFKDVKTNESLGVFYVCGRVNAKNSFGAYRGWKRFFVDLNTDKVSFEPSFDIGENYIKAWETIWDISCN